MSDDEGFLHRWSRRKRAAVADAEVPAVEPGAPPPEAAAPTPDARASKPDVPASKPDLASLPSLDMITAQTDIRGFLAPGVPAELTRAALRRAWAADPQIRDFIGIAENQWDFTAPDGLYGFGQLGVEEARRLAAAIIGQRDDGPAAGRDVGTADMPEKTALPAPEGAAIQSRGAPVPEGSINHEASPVSGGAVATETGASHRPGEDPPKVGEVSVESGRFVLQRTHGRALPE